MPDRQDFALVDVNGNSVASYSYDSWGALTTSSESFANGWSNPYRYDGHDGARFDASDGSSWLAVRAYDPSSGRFLSRDPLGRAPLFRSDNPYVYAGNNPITNVDPSGQKVMGASNSQVKHAAQKQASKTWVATRPGSPAKKSACDRRRQHDTQLILEYLELTRAQNHLGSDILALFADVVIAVVGDVTQSWISFVTDLVAVIVQGTQVGKDFAILHGASAQSLIGLNHSTRASPLCKASQSQ